MKSPEGYVEGDAVSKLDLVQLEQTKRAAHE